MSPPVERYFAAVRELMIPDDDDEPRRAWLEALIGTDRPRVAGMLLFGAAAIIGVLLPLAALWFSATHLLNLGPGYLDRRFGLLLAISGFGASCLVGTGVFLAVFRAGASVLYRLRR